jgi:hypothetical protein
VIVGRSPQIRDRNDGGAFLVFGEPLPVGTRIAFKLDEKEQHARVTEVVESADASAAGMRVRFLSAAERDRSGPVAVPAVAAPAPAAAAPAAAAPAPAAVEPSQPSASAVPTPVGGDSSSSSASAAVPAGESSAHHATDPNAPHHDGEGGRKRRRRK